MALLEVSNRIWYTHSPAWMLTTSLSPLSVWAIATAMIGRQLSGRANKPNTTPPTVPVRKPTFLPDRKTSTEKVRATWLGHACYYVEFPTGLRVLFDPVFEDRCSPFSWLGPKRYTEIPCEIAALPAIDAVVISHSHYDHLSHGTVSEIARLHPNAHFFAPLGNKKWFIASGITKVTELDWWEEVDLMLRPETAAASQTQPDSKNELSEISARISCLPCQHTSGRTPFDRATTLWSSWSVTSPSPSTNPISTPSPSKSVYFAGDTGYRAVPRASDGHDDWGAEYANLPHCPAFADIGRLRGPFDLGLIPIGAYMPRFVMSPMHANPRDAVEIFRDTKCKSGLGMHWGTWVLTEEDVLEPPKLLREALRHHGMEETGVFDIIDIGESREF